MDGWMEKRYVMVYDTPLFFVASFFLPSLTGAPTFLVIV